MKLELTGVVRHNGRDNWTFETMINNKPYVFGNDRIGSGIPSAIDEILEQFDERLTEAGQLVRITIER